GGIVRPRADAEQIRKALPAKMSKTTPCTVAGACGINDLRCEPFAKPRFDSSGKTPASCHDPANASSELRLLGTTPPRADGEPDRRDQEVDRTHPSIACDIRDRRRLGHRGLKDEEAAG